MSSCIDPETGRMLGRYEFDLLSTDEKIKFESHLMECDVCYQDYYEFSPIVTKIKKHRSEFKNVLEQNTPDVSKGRILHMQLTFRRILSVAAVLVIAIISYSVYKHIQSQDDSIVQVIPHEGESIPPKAGQAIHLFSSTEADQVRLSGTMDVSYHPDSQELMFFWQPADSAVNAKVMLYRGKQLIHTLLPKHSNGAYNFILQPVQMDTLMNWVLHAGLANGQVVDARYSFEKNNDRIFKTVQ